MNIFYILAYMIIVFFLSSMFTRYLISFTKKKNIIDYPNSRSSHDLPTPRGGGLSISLLIIVSLGFSFYFYPGKIYFLVSLICALIISILGFFDDIVNLKASLKAFFYFSLSTFFVGMFFYNETDFLNEVLLIIALIFLISWMINLFNFMDGADAFSSIQAISAALPTALYFYLSNNIEYAILCFTIVSATLGFLIWNWPPAKIFMGDVGSCVLGFIFGSLMLVSYTQELISIYIWLILLSVFIVDSTLTLLKRILNREEWYKAHCSHSYQYYMKMGNSHKKLALNFIFFSLIIIWPASYLVFTIPGCGLYLTSVIYFILIIFWYSIQKEYCKAE